MTQKAIAQQIEVPASAVCREIKKNKNKQGKYGWTVANAVTDLLLPYKKYVRTITTDNGSEFRFHEIIAKNLSTTVYFADSYSSWQKGVIENTN